MAEHDQNPNAQATPTFSFRLRRPRASIEAEMGGMEHSAHAGTALMLEVLLDIRDLLEERLPMPIFVAGSGSVPPQNT